MYRGEINGAQDGLNSTMDTIKFALVIVLPNVETFGYLIIATVSAYILGGIFFTTYAFPNKGEEYAASSDPPGGDVSSKCENGRGDSKNKHGDVRDKKLSTVPA